MFLAFKSHQSLLLQAVNTILQLSQCLRNVEPLTLVCPEWNYISDAIGLWNNLVWSTLFTPKVKRKSTEVVWLIAVKNTNWILKWILSWGENKLNAVLRNTLVISTKLSFTRILKLQSPLQQKFLFPLPVACQNQFLSLMLLLSLFLSYNNYKHFANLQSLKMERDGGKNGKYVLYKEEKK